MRWMPFISKKTVEVVIATGNDLVVQLKANQPGLLNLVQLFRAEHPFEERDHQVDWGRRNRIEQRETRYWSLPAGFGGEAWQGAFRSLPCVVRTTEVFDPASKTWCPRREEPACYLSTTQGTAGAFAGIIRAHWGVENRLHHVLDVSMGEYASRIRRNPGIFALPRQLALNLLHHNGHSNIRAALYDNAICLNRVLAYQGGI